MRRNYDPKTDGNVYHWILAQSALIRAARAPVKRPTFTDEQRRFLAQLDEQIEEDERRRFNSIRSALRERKATERKAKREQP